MFNLNLALVVISDHVGERKKEENVFVMGGVFMVAEIVGDLIPFSLAKVSSPLFGFRPLQAHYALSFSLHCLIILLTILLFFPYFYW